MKRRKYSNGCLLSLLRTIVVGSFVVLMSFFGMYTWMVAQNKEGSNEVAGSANNLEEMHTNAKSIGSIEKVETLVDESYQQEEEVATVWSESKNNTDEKPLQHEEAPHTPDIGGVEGVMITDGDIATSTEDSIQPSDENNGAKEVVQVEETQEIQEIQIEMPTDISVYNRYALNLDDGVLKEAQEMIKDGQIDVTTVVAQYFASMSMQEKMRLINMLIAKIKNIDIRYVWGIVADGITIEETAILQKLIEENFTEKEIDELYMYYAKSELAQLP